MLLFLVTATYFSCKYLILSLGEIIQYKNMIIISSLQQVMKWAIKYCILFIVFHFFFLGLSVAVKNEAYLIIKKKVIKSFKTNKD